MTSRNLMIAEALDARSKTHAEMTDAIARGVVDPERFADMADTLAYYNRLLVNLGWTPETV